MLGLEISLYFIVHIAAAVCVIIHILLHKRDPTAAVGWIGACVLMPWIGIILYLFFGINRVRRRAQKMIDEGDSLTKTPPSTDAWVKKAEEKFAPLDHMLKMMTGRPLAGSNTVEIIHNGDHAYPIMLDFIGKAQHSVLLCSYIFRNDYLGMEFVEALRQARARGVEVRVLIDGVGSGYFFCAIARKFKKAGIPCARFMHSFLPWRMPFVNLRNHRKILVVDGKTGFMGGLNIGAENILAKPVRGFLSVSDTHFHFQGPIVRQMAEVFVRDWVFTTGETLGGPLYFPEPEQKGTIPARIVTSGPDEDVEKISYTMLQALTLARKHVCLMSPYFIPDERFATELGLAAIRGVRVDIVVPRHSNHYLVDYARNACLQQLIESGCHIWLGDPPFNHSKLMTVDDCWSFVGSANLDSRSLRLNFEVNVELHDNETAIMLREFIQKHGSNNELTAGETKSWSFWVRIRDAAFRLFAPYL